MEKLGRNYQLLVEVATTPTTTDTLTIELPFTIEFDITRNSLSSANVCQIRVYNLAPINREQIYFNGSDQTNYRSVVLKAGYGNNLSTIFTGNISRAWSVREGVNFITQIECYDGGFGLVTGEKDWPGLTFPAGTPLKTVITALMLAIPRVQIGAVGNFPGVLNRGNTYSGNPGNILTELTGGAFFIDGGKSYALLTNEYVVDDGPIIVVNSGSGLLNTPILEQTIARFEMLFEPDLNVGRLVKVDSQTNNIFNRFYKISSVKHRGIISPVVSGSAITIGEFSYYKDNVPVGEISG